ncbi:HD domain-containing phosphohydrolase [Halioxenophilus sp. WMMB6]|uniref:response regulator n=1 Tax=Halioxenophilus sp. WMMB6 TaxID=3073815 RepID=UPI00295EB755|nr:HD domain-containing phosphohydrolase [Halioxenophilus sp. WMMB6]
MEFVAEQQAEDSISVETLEGKILIVDDDPVNIAIFEKILRQAGYHRIDSTIDPGAVRALYRNNGYDLIALDIHMPIWTGFDVLEQLRADNPTDYLPVLVLTSDTGVETQNRCLASGAKDFITKPFKKEEVLLRVHNILEVRLLHKQLKQQRDQLEEKVLERTQQLYNTQLKLIESLAKTAEYRDTGSGSHVARISQYVVILGRELGLSREECDLLQQASPMHDLGKIAIPDNVLLKCGNLDDDEWETVKAHSEIGAQILSAHDSRLMQVAATIARTHHERWDGRGYPAGLKGEEIPLFSRIVSVCDVFDALTSERPHREGWKVSRALNYLRENSGSQFDPNVVQSFERVIDQILLCRQADLETEGREKVLN